jgi:hypothetical protein
VAILPPGIQTAAVKLRELGGLTCAGSDANRDNVERTVYRQREERSNALERWKISMTAFEDYGCALDADRQYWLCERSSSLRVATIANFVTVHSKVDEVVCFDTIRKCSFWQT